jgi:hypothetical protein
MKLDLPEAELKATEEKIIKDLRTAIRRKVFEITTQHMATPPVLILSALGVDPEEKILQIFMEEATRLLNKSKETTDAG